MHRIRSIRGFSLIELLLVVAIIGTVSVIAIPRYANSASVYRVEVTARRIAADLASVQARARAMGSNVKMSFSSATETYTLPAEGDRTFRTLNSVDISAAPFLASLSGVNFGGDETIIFNGYGVPDSGGSLTVQSGRFTRTIILQADSGVISIQ